MTNTITSTDHIDKASAVVVDEALFRGLVRAAQILERWQDGKIWDSTAADALESARKVGLAPPAPPPTAAVELARAGMLPESRGRERDTIDALSALLDRVRAAAGAVDRPVLALPDFVRGMVSTLAELRGRTNEASSACDAEADQVVTPLVVTPMRVAHEMLRLACDRVKAGDHDGAVACVHAYGVLTGRAS
jgi:hypothetical protein